MRRGEEARLKAILKEHELLKKEQYKRSQVLFDLRQKERELISEIRWAGRRQGARWSLATIAIVPLPRENQGVSHRQPWNGARQGWGGCTGQEVRNDVSPWPAPCAPRPPLS